MIAPVLRFFMRVCMEPRLLPGVRCSVLNTVKSWPSCWMTMPGRSCVALTLLISSLEVAISEIQAGQDCGRIRNDSRHAGAFLGPGAKKQYKVPSSARSIIGWLATTAFRNPGVPPQRASRNNAHGPGANHLASFDKPGFPGHAS